MKIRSVLVERHAWRGIGPVSEDQQLDLFPNGYRLGCLTFWSSPKRASESGGLLTKRLADELRRARRDADSTIEHRGKAK